jgi:hypothetical protein
MSLFRSIRRPLMLAALLCLPAPAIAQTPASAPQHVSEAGRSAVKVHMVPSLIVLNARGADLQGQTENEHRTRR